MFQVRRDRFLERKGVMCERTHERNAPARGFGLVLSETVGRTAWQTQSAGYAIIQAAYFG
jgi:hypothetical protein